MSASLKITRRAFSAGGASVALSLGVGRANAAKDFTIGVVNPLTGFGADLGICAQQSLECVVDELNKAGGINGSQIRFVFRDDESNPQKGVAAVQELLQRHNVDVIVGANLTNIAVAVAPIINQAKVPFILFGTGSTLIDPAKFPYLFRTNFHTDMESALIADYALRVLKAKSPGVISDTSAYGQTGSKALIEALAKVGVTPAAHETFALTDTDLSGQVLRLQKANADAILGWSVGTALAQVARAAQRLNFDVPGVGGAGIHQEGFVDLAGSAGKGWSGTYYRSFTRTADEDAPADVRAYLKKMQDRFGAGLSKTMYVAALWDDTIRLLAEAAKRAKSTSGDDVKNALEASNFKGMISDFTFSPTKHDGMDPKALTLAYAIGLEPHVRVRVPGLA
jgi:branched-chain amino acid transport system substrate-binding protein